MALSPILKSLGSKGWPEVTCVIDSSEVESHSSSDGTTYSVEISFTYSVKGASYQSDTYNFSSASSSGRGGKAEVVARYPVDSMHSFDSGNNKITWHIAVDGEIPRFPDIKNTYPITVRPAPLS